jgi:hypothetical protein
MKLFILVMTFLSSFLLLKQVKAVEETNENTESLQQMLRSRIADMSCTEATMRCSGQKVQLCHRGGWYTSRTCSSPQVCKVTSTGYVTCA